MKAGAILLFLLILACALLAGHQRMPIEQMIDEPDANPDVWPAPAAAADEIPVDMMPNLLMTPCPVVKGQRMERYKGVQRV